MVGVMTTLLHAAAVGGGATEAPRPLQVELLAPLDGPRLFAGAPIFAKTLVRWANETCHLEPGGLVSGHVVAVEPGAKGSRAGSATLLFDSAECGGKRQVMRLLLYAMVMRPDGVNLSGMVDRAGLFGSTSARPAMGPGGGWTAAPPRENASQDQNLGGWRGAAPAEAVHAGQVLGQSDLTLSVGTGAEGGTVVRSRKRNVRLEAGTQIVLVVPEAPARVAAEEDERRDPARSSRGAAKTEERIAIATNDGRGAVESAPTRPTPARPEFDETEICAKDCSTVPLEASHAAAQVRASADMSRLGYRPHDRRRYTELGYESTLSYLGSDQILFTFDLHQMRHRYERDGRVGSMRTIRAVVLDAKTLRPTRVVNWPVEGEGQYLWPVADGRVLVHLGEQLRLFGRDLELVRSVEVPGELRFVAVSPRGGRFAVGVLRERYSQEMRRRLEETLGKEPEESLAVQLLDEHFRVLLASEQTTLASVPVLSERGELIAVDAGRGRWQVVEQNEDHGKRVVATVASSCEPQLATPVAEHVFVVGCRRSPYQNWYRMLRLDGGLVLRGRGSSEEFEQAAVSDGDASAFAVRVGAAAGHGGAG